MGPSSHSIQFDDGPLRSVVLRRHGNGGEPFALEESVLSEGTAPPPQAPRAKVERTPTVLEGQQKVGIARLPSHQEDL